MKKIYIGTDHAGFEMKEDLKKWLIDLGYEVIDKGALEYNEGNDKTELRDTQNRSEPDRAVR